MLELDGRVFVDAGPPPPASRGRPAPTTPGPWVEVIRVTRLDTYLHTAWDIPRDQPRGETWRSVHLVWVGGFGEVVTVPRRVLVWDSAGERVYEVMRFSAAMQEQWRVRRWEYDVEAEARVPPEGD